MCYINEVTPYEKLNNELKDAGAIQGSFFDEQMDFVSSLVNTKQSSKKYVDIFIKYFNDLSESEKEMVVRASTEKGNYKVVPILIDLFKNHLKYNESLLWATSNALFVIDDKTHYDDILEISRNKKLGMTRQMLFSILPKIKTEEAFQVLVDNLNDETVKAHAIEALGKFGDKRGIEILEKVEVRKGLFESKAKLTALKRLTRR